MAEGHVMAARTLWILLSCFVSLPAFGAGFEYNENGANILGRSGAFTAKADHPMTIHNNPAGLLNWSGHRLYLGANLNSVSLSFERFGIDDLVADGTYPSATAENEGPPFVAPSVAWGYAAENWAVGFGIYGPGAMGLRSFAPDGPQRFLLIDEDFLLGYASLTGALRLGDKLSFGVALQFVTMPSAKMSLTIDAKTAKGKEQDETDAWMATAETDMSDWVGASAILGLHYRPTSWLEVGLSSRPMPIDVRATGELGLSFPNPDTQKLLDKGSLATVDGACDQADGCPPSTAGRLELSLPPWIRFGIRYVDRDDAGDEIFDVELDVFYEFWSELERYRIIPEYQISFLGQLLSVDPIDIPKKYQDAWSIRLGSDVRLVPELLKMHLGIHYESPAAQKATTNLDFTSFHRIGTSLGFTARFDPVEITLAYQFVHQPDWTVSEDEAEMTIIRPTSNVETPVVINAGTYRSYYQTLSLGVVTVF